MIGKNHHRRILGIDDNQSIHLDFRKIFSRTANPAASLDSAESFLFESAETESAMPCFQVDFALQGQEGLEMIEQARQSGKPYTTTKIMNFVKCTIKGQ